MLKKNILQLSCSIIEGVGKEIDENQMNKTSDGMKQAKGFALQVVTTAEEILKVIKEKGITD